MTYIIDFDNTCVVSPRDKYPQFIEDVPHAERVLKQITEVKNDKDEQKHTLILHTMRTNETLEKAVHWFSEKNIPLGGINQNPVQTWTDSTKIYGVIIDDYAIGCPKIQIEGLWVVDWLSVERWVLGHKADEENLRQWFLKIKGEFNISQINKKLLLSSDKLKNFIAAKKYRHLGDDFSRVEKWAIERGYEPYYTYDPIL